MRAIHGACLHGHFSRCKESSLLEKRKKKWKAGKFERESAPPSMNLDEAQEGILKQGKHSISPINHPDE